MSSVGAYLRQLRTQRGVSLEEIARSTRVLHSYLEALEADDYAALPAAVFTKGFIRAYCQALGAAPDDALALWERRGGEADAATPTAPPARPATEAMKRREAAETRTRGAVLAGFVMLVVLGLALFGMAIWLQPSGVSRSDGPAGAPSPTPETGPAQPARTSAPVEVAKPAEPPAAAPATPTPPLPTAPVPTAPVTTSPGAARIVGVTPPYRLVARTSERTWMRVRTEDGRESEENIPPGETREWVSNRPFVVTIGNAGGVALELNGQRVPQLGARGAVIERLILPADTR